MAEYDVNMDAGNLADANQRRAHRWRIVRWAVASLALVIPFIGMQVSQEWDWTTGDFIFAAVLAGGTALLYEGAVRAAPNIFYRAGAAIAVITSLLLIWSNLAVGIVGSEDHPLNLLFFVVPVIGFAGAVMARLRPAGMARALLATAVAHALVATGVLVAMAGLTAAPIFERVANGVFVALWLASAVLFKQAARAKEPLHPASRRT